MPLLYLVAINAFSIRSASIVLKSLSSIKRLNEKVVDKQSNDGYTIELVAIDNIKWPFGSCKGRLVLKNKDNKVICRQKIEVNNDGTTIDKSNWKVEWKADRVVVTIKGYDDSEEKIYTLFLVNN